MEKKETVPEKKRRDILKLKAYHKELFQKEGVAVPKFIPKVCYYDKNIGERVVGFYKSEVLGCQDIYVECATKDYQVEDLTRTLYRWPYNPEYETEYAKSDAHPVTKHQRYLVPIDELINVTQLHEPKPALEEPVKEGLSTNVSLDFDDVLTGDDDAPFADMTIRDFAAITWKMPISQRNWLNKLITNNK